MFHARRKSSLTCFSSVTQTFCWDIHSWSVRMCVQHKVALCQLAVTPDKDGNIARARARVEAAADAGAKLVVLPASRPLPLSVTDVFTVSNHKSLTTEHTESVSTD
jgi:hypothetical protein